MQKFDFYTGFEGEEEIIIFQKDIYNNIKVEISLWSGFFNSIVDLIPPNSCGCWEGITLHYHLYTGWYDSDIPWLCDDKHLYKKQLQIVDKEQLNIEEQEILKILIDIFDDAILSNDNIYIYYS